MVFEINSQSILQVNLQLTFMLVVVTLECPVIPGTSCGLLLKVVCVFLSLESISVHRHIYSAGCSYLFMAVSAGTKTYLSAEIPSRLNSPGLSTSSGNLEHFILGFLLLNYLASPILR